MEGRSKSSRMVASMHVWLSLLQYSVLTISKSFQPCMPLLMDNRQVSASRNREPVLAFRSGAQQDTFDIGCSYQQAEMAICKF